MDYVIRQCCQCRGGLIRVKGDCAVFLQAKAFSISLVKLDTPATSGQDVAKTCNGLGPVIR